MQEYISESIEPPTNPQFLNSSGHVQWSLHNLRNIRKGKFCNIFGGKYLEIHVHVPSKHPQQHIYHLQKSNLSQDESLFNSEHFITPTSDERFKSYRFLSQKSAFFPPWFISNKHIGFQNSYPSSQTNLSSTIKVPSYSQKHNSPNSNTDNSKGLFNWLKWWNQKWSKIMINIFFGESLM
jgi:hypothetical protein